MLRVNVRSAAKADLAETLAYYASTSPSLADAFLDQFDSALTLLRENPRIGSRRFAHFYPHIDLRTWSLDRFPFRIFYILKGDTLHVLRVDHERRNVTVKTIASIPGRKKRPRS